MLTTFVTLVLTAWLFLEIGFLAGTRGPNRYGPNPLGEKQGDASL